MGRNAHIFPPPMLIIFLLCGHVILVKGQRRSSNIDSRHTVLRGVLSVSEVVGDSRKGYYSCLSLFWSNQAKSKIKLKNVSPKEKKKGSAEFFSTKIMDKFY